MIREDGLLKYPRTPHLEGSRLQPGDITAQRKLEEERLPKRIRLQRKPLPPE